MRHPLTQERRINYGRNLVFYNHKYDGVLTNERGTVELNQLPGSIMGQLRVDDKIFLWFEKELGCLENGEYTTIKKYSKLCEDISATYSYNDCNELELYWTDCTIDKYVNLEQCNLDECKDTLSYCSDCPNYEITKSDSGGNLSPGLYQIVLRTEENWCTPSKPITIGPDIFCNNNNSSINISFEGTAEIAVIKIIDKIKTAQFLGEFNNSYTYTGQRGEEMQLEEIYTSSVSYISSKDMIMLNDTLVRANVCENKIESFQSYANKIKPYWKTLKIPIEQAADIKSFMRDETYAGAIRYIYCDGTKTEYFHIPGIESSDPKYLEYVDDCNNFRDCPTKYFHVYNTAKVTSRPHIPANIVKDCDSKTIDYGCWEKGELAYTESCNSVYPDTKDCDGNLVYGDLAGQPVRYWKMPDNDISCSFSSNKTPENAVEIPNIDFENCEGKQNNTKPYDESYVYPLVIEFENIEIPKTLCDRIIGYEIAIVKRTDDNSSVLAKGLLHHAYGGYGFDGRLYAVPSNGVNGKSLLDSFMQDSFLLANSDLLTNVFEQKDKQLPFNNSQLIDAYTFHSPDTCYVNKNIQADYIKVEKSINGYGVFYGNNEDEYRGARANINMFEQDDCLECRQYSISGIQQAQGNSLVENGPGITYPLYNVYKESSVYLELDKHEKGHIPLCKPHPGDYNSAGDVTDNDKSECPSDDVTNNNSQDNSWCFTEQGIYNDKGIGLDNCKCLKEDAEGNARCINGSSHYVSLKRYLCDQYGSVENLVYDPITFNSNADTFAQGDSYITYDNYIRTGVWYDEEKIAGVGIQDGCDVAPTWTMMIHGFFESSVNTYMKDCKTYPLCDSKLLDPSFDGNTGYTNTVLGDFHYYDTTGGGSNEKIQSGIRNWTDNCCEYDETFSISNENIGASIDSTCCEQKCHPGKIVYSSGDTRNFLENNQIDLEGETIVKLIDMGNELYAHTTTNLWRIGVTGQSIEGNLDTFFVGSNSFFNQQPIKVYSNPKDTLGLQNKNHCFQNEAGYVWVDTKSATLNILRGKGNVEEIKIFVQEKAKKELCDGDFKITYDYCNERYLLTKKDNWTISFQIENEFYNFHDFIPDDYICDRKELLSIKDGKLYSHTSDKYHEFYGKSYPFELEVIIPNSKGKALKSLEVFVETTKNCENLCEFYDEVIIYTPKHSTGKITEFTQDNHSWIVAASCSLKADTLDPYCDCKPYKENLGQNIGKIDYPYFIVRFILNKNDINIVHINEKTI